MNKQPFTSLFLNKPVGVIFYRDAPTWIICLHIKIKLIIFSITDIYIILDMIRYQSTFCQTDYKKVLILKVQISSGTLHHLTNVDLLWIICKQVVHTYNTIQYIFYFCRTFKVLSSIKAIDSLATYIHPNAKKKSCLLTANLLLSMLKRKYN